MTVRSVKDVKLVVKPVFFAMEHKYYYEGPCRMSSGDALEPGFDAIVNGKIYEGMQKALDFNLRNDERFEVLEPAVLRMTDDWDIKEEWFEDALADDNIVDFYLIQTAFGANTLIEEFALRTKKPMGANPFKMYGQATFASSVRRGADVIFSLSWPELKDKLLCLRAEKAMRTANVLLAPRFGGDKAIAGGTDTFDSLCLARDKFGTNFRYVNVHELMDYLSPLPKEGNHTTPGRKTMNITPEEIAWCEELADTLMAAATECQITFCLTHSLNLERGVGSACEYDVTSVLCMILEMALTGKAAYMGNTLPAPLGPDGEVNFSDPKYSVPIDGDKNNLYLVSHSTPCRCLHSFDELDDFALRHFALDAGFGAIQRHDFDADKGQVITMIRISSDCKEMFIGRGEIVAGFGYDSDNCNGGFVFRVADEHDFFEKHVTFGLHLPLVYGDYVDQFVFIAKRLGLTPVVA